MPGDPPSRGYMDWLALAGSALQVPARRNFLPNNTTQLRPLLHPAQMLSRSGASPHQSCRRLAPSPRRYRALLARCYQLACGRRFDMELLRLGAWTVDVGSSPVIAEGFPLIPVANEFFEKLTHPIRNFRDGN